MHRRLSPTASVRRSALSATTAPTMIPHSLQESPLMWVFGYGSLMWDQWEQQFGGSHVDGASLMSYRRSFNKASTRNWGTRNSPGPTLGLEPSQESYCIGTAFQFPDETADAVSTYLRNREGASFTLTQLPVRLPNEETIQAVDAANSIRVFGGWTLQIQMGPFQV